MTNPTTLGGDGGPPKQATYQYALTSRTLGKNPHPYLSSLAALPPAAGQPHEYPRACICPTVSPKEQES